jgi:hypothetical protein
MPSFLFVNKDAESASLTRSNADEQTSINSHVQRGRRHKRGAGTVARGGGKARKPHGSRKSKDAPVDPVLLGIDHAPQPKRRPSSAPPTGNVITNDDGSPRAFPTRPSSTSGVISVSAHQRSNGQPQPRKKHHPVRKSSKLPQDHFNEMILLNPHHPFTQPQDVSQYTSKHLDPFGQSVVRLDPQVARLCRYFCENFHPGVWNNNAYTFHESAIQVVRRAMQNEVEMNAMLACMAARIENVDMVPDQGTEKYMQQALVAVRSRFNTAPKHQLLLIVFHLYAAEAYRMNYPAAKIHMKAAKVLFDSWGGLAHIPDPALRELFIMGDGHMSSLQLEPCQLPCTYDPGPFAKGFPALLHPEQYEELLHIAPMLQRLCNDNFFPHELVQVIHETIECNWVMQQPQQTDPALAKGVAKWLVIRGAAIRHRLLGLQYPGSSLDPIRITLLMWILASMVILGLKRLVGIISTKFRNIIWMVEDPNRQWSGLEHVRSWALTIGAMCAMPGSEEERWFIDNLFTTGFVEYIRHMGERHPQLDTLDILKTFQMNFFYYEAHQRPRLERLARLLDGGSSDMSSSASQTTGSPSSHTARSRSTQSPPVMGQRDV